MAEKVNMAVKLDPGIRERPQALGEAKRRSPHCVSFAQYDAFTLNDNIAKIIQELTAWAQAKTNDTPSQVLNVVVGNIQLSSEALDVALFALSDLFLELRLLLVG